MIEIQESLFLLRFDKVRKKGIIIPFLAFDFTLFLFLFLDTLFVFLFQSIS